MFVIGLPLFVGIIALAIKGIGYRGLYFAGAVLALVVGVFFVLITPSAAAVAATTDLAQRTGSEFLYNNGHEIAGASFAVALAALVGGIAFRPQPNR